MAKKFAKLNHFCGRKGCEGNPGDVIEVAPEVLKFLLDRDGAVECDKNGAPLPELEEKPVQDGGDK